MLEKLRWAGLPHRERVSRDGSGFPRADRAQRLREKYLLAGWVMKYGRATIAEALCVLDLLDRVPALPLPPDFRVLDVGCDDWRHLPALDAWRRGCYPEHKASLVGLESRAYDLYPTLKTRASVARYFVKVLRSGSFHPHYRPGDIRNLTGGYDLVLCLFPRFKPKDIVASVARVCACVARDGYLILASAAPEDAKQIRGLKPVHEQKLTDALSPGGAQPIFLTVWTRDE
jgi:hypothetical protein